MAKTLESVAFGFLIPVVLGMGFDVARDTASGDLRWVGLVIGLFALAWLIKLAGRLLKRGAA